MKALILIDIQNDFLPGGALAVPQGNLIIPVINKLQKYFELVVSTQDWHPANHKSFASQHNGKLPFDEIEWHGKQQKLWPDHCIQGSKGAEFPLELEMNRTEAIFRKGTDPQIDSYSGFYDNDHKRSTGLADYLHGKKIRQVYLTGLAADICVFFTGMDSLKEGFETLIIEDATKALSMQDFRNAKNIFIQDGGKMIVSKDLAMSIDYLNSSKY